MLSTGGIVTLVLAILVGSAFTPLSSNSLFVTQKLFQPYQIAQNILLVTAHPDDETMFFSPTILDLAPRTDIGFFHVCLSTGNADGEGPRRKVELGYASDILGLEKRKRWVLDHPELQDNFTAEWSPEVISKALKPYVTELKIDTILTFDSHGISGHPNHKSIPKGVKHLLKSLNATAFASVVPPPSSSPNTPAVPRLFTLFTTPIITKYLSFPIAFLNKADLYIYIGLQNLEHFIINTIALWDPEILTPAIPRHEDAGAMPTFVNGYEQYLKTLDAMQAHESQMVWFRWLYVGFSRYLWANSWDEVKDYD